MAKRKAARCHVYLLPTFKKGGKLGKKRRRRICWNKRGKIVSNRAA